jgi:hypothetical protein
MAFAVIWIRMAMHYLGEYLILKIMNCPVISLTLYWYKFEIDYAFSNIGEQVGVICFGVLINTLAFLFLILICYMS